VGNRWTELLLRAQRGEFQLFGQLAEEVRPLLLGGLRACEHTQALFHSREDVEDALQEAFLKAWRCLPAYDAARGGAVTWLWILTMHSAIDLLRRRKTFVVSIHGHDGSPTLDVPGREPDPAALAVAEELRERLDRTLRAAGRQARLAWELRFSQGMRYADIARLLGQPLGSIASRIYSLKMGLRQSLT
jgi:RNA polymerase sigma-70 factor (ECF subfamily)